MMLRFNPKKSVLSNHFNQSPIVWVCNADKSIRLLLIDQKQLMEKSYKAYKSPSREIIFSNMEITSPCLSNAVWKNSDEFFPRSKVSRILTQDLPSIL